MENTNPIVYTFFWINNSLNQGLQQEKDINSSSARERKWNL